MGARAPSADPGRGTSHHLTVLQQENGELQEDVRRYTEPCPGGDPDEAGDESFPASDPPAGWAGSDDPPPVPERVLHRRPIGEVEGRRTPDEPVPGTIER